MAGVTFDPHVAGTPYRARRATLRRGFRAVAGADRIGPQRRHPFVHLALPGFARLLARLRCLITLGRAPIDACLCRRSAFLRAGFARLGALAFPVGHSTPPA
jgi:hypothetical protein